MRFEILDVGHGFCARLVNDDRRVMLFDCGHKSEPEFRPSNHLSMNRCTGIDRLIISNYDEDHISDLPRILSKFDVQTLVRNPSISAEQLRALKRQSGSISHAMECLLTMIEKYREAPTELIDFPNTSWSVYFNEYLVDFEDTNNLSLVTFLQCGGLYTILPGDLEEPGWKKLLQNNNFTAELRRVNVFVASHHGRESGYCEEVFSYCNPDVVIFSDGPIEHTTQEMSDTYARHATGMNFNGRTRKVVTTRDGTIGWDL